MNKGGRVAFYLPQDKHVAAWHSLSAPLRTLGGQAISPCAHATLLLLVSCHCRAGTGNRIPYLVKTLSWCLDLGIISCPPPLLAFYRMLPLRGRMPALLRILCHCLTRCQALFPRHLPRCAPLAPNHLPHTHHAPHIHTALPPTKNKLHLRLGGTSLLQMGFTCGMGGQGRAWTCGTLDGVPGHLHSPLPWLDMPADTNSRICRHCRTPLMYGPAAATSQAHTWQRQHLPFI